MSQEKTTPKLKPKKRYPIRIPDEIEALLLTIKKAECYTSINQTIIECIKNKYISITKI
jgi:hypothetical protein